MDPVQYQVRDETSIRHITMSQFLSHDQTKNDLTEYLAVKTLDYNKDSPKLVITSAAGHTRSNKDVGSFPDNNHEKADTLMICLGVSSTERNSRDAKIAFFFSRYRCPGPDHSQLLWIAKEHLNLHGFRCPAGQAIIMAKALPSSLGQTTLDGLQELASQPGSSCSWSPTLMSSGPCACFVMIRM